MILGRRLREIWHFPLYLAGHPIGTLPDTHYQGFEGKKSGPHLVLIFSILGAIIAGIAVIDLGKIFS